MTRARLRALGLAVVCAVIAALAFAQLRRPAQQAQRPVLLLLTGLPLVFGEDFSVKGGGSPALTELQSRYRVVMPDSLAMRSDGFNSATSTIPADRITILQNRTLHDVLPRCCTPLPQSLTRFFAWFP